jgi:hypothetical protein
VFTAGLALATFTPLVLAPLLAPRNGRGTAETLGVLVVVVYSGHLAVTGWLWTVPRVQQTVRSRPWRLVVLPALLVVLGTLTVLTTTAQVLEWLLLGFFAWQFVHFQRQNLGLVKLVANKWNAEPLTVPECRILAVVGWCGIAELFAHPTLLDLSRLSLTPVLTGPMRSLALVGLGICTVAGAISAFRSRRPAPVAGAYLTAVLFVVPLFLFKTAAAAVTGMVVAHGLQYLWAVGWRSHAERRLSRLEGWLAAGAIAVVATAGGALLAAMSELRSAHTGGVRTLYGVYLGIVMAHFALDAVLWRRPTPTQPRAAYPHRLSASPTAGTL